MSLFEAATNPPTHPKYHPNRFEFWLLHFENHDSESAPYLRKPQRIFQLKVVYLHLSLPMHYLIQLFLDGLLPLKQHWNQKGLDFFLLR